MLQRPIGKAPGGLPGCTLNSCYSFTRAQPGDAIRFKPAREWLLLQSRLHMQMRRKDLAML